MFKFLVIVSTTVLSIVSSYPFETCIEKCQPSNNPFEIPSLLVHQDCTKYCLCENGCPKVKKCPRNFHFSLEERMCLPVELAKCDDYKNCLGMCPIVYNPHNVLLLPHNNSSKYCHCREWGIPIVETCPKSLVFNIKKVKCEKLNPDCHNNVNEIEGPAVRSTGIIISSPTTTTVPPILPSDLDGPILIITNDVPTSTSPTSPSYSDDGTTISSIRNDHTAINITPNSPHVYFKTDDFVASVSNSKNSTTILSNIDDSATTASKNDQTSNKDNEVTVLPNNNDSTTSKADVNVQIPIVVWTSQSNNQIETTVVSKIDDSTTSKADTDVLIPIVVSTSQSNDQVETTVASKIDDSTTPRVPSNVPKKNIIPCNCTRIVYVDKNNYIPINTEKVHVNHYIPMNVGDCIGQCPPENDSYYTLPHKSCEHFCMCNWGEATVKQCPSHLHYNVEYQICDYPINAKCTGIGAITTD